MFIFIGAAPRTVICSDLVSAISRDSSSPGRDVCVDGRRPPGWTLERDPYLFETSVPGIFSAGDARAVRASASLQQWAKARRR